jgi:sec-independent protein translocase protein TatA
VDLLASFIGQPGDNMGLGNIRPLSLLLILLIIVALFGTDKLKNIGSDLGNAIKNFRRALNEDEDKK